MIEIKKNNLHVYELPPCDEDEDELFKAKDKQMKAISDLCCAFVSRDNTSVSITFAISLSERRRYCDARHLCVCVLSAELRLHAAMRSHDCTCVAVCRAVTAGALH